MKTKTPRTIIVAAAALATFTSCSTLPAIFAGHYPDSDKPVDRVFNPETGNYDWTDSNRSALAARSD